MSIWVVGSIVTLKNHLSQLDITFLFYKLVQLEFRIRIICTSILEKLYFGKGMTDHQQYANEKHYICSLPSGPSCQK